MPSSGGYKLTPRNERNTTIRRKQLSIRFKPVSFKHVRNFQTSKFLFDRFFRKPVRISKIINFRFLRLAQKVRYNRRVLFYPKWRQHQLVRRKFINFNTNYNYLWKKSKKTELNQLVFTRLDLIKNNIISFRHITKKNHFFFLIKPWLNLKYLNKFTNFRTTHLFAKSSSLFVKHMTFKAEYDSRSLLALTKLKVFSTLGLFKYFHILGSNKLRSHKNMSFISLPFVRKIKLKIKKRLVSFLFQYKSISSIKKRFIKRIFLRYTKLKHHLFFKKKRGLTPLLPLRKRWYFFLISRTSRSVDNHLFLKKYFACLDSFRLALDFQFRLQLLLNQSNPLVATSCKFFTNSIAFGQKLNEFVNFCIMGFKVSHYHLLKLPLIVKDLKQKTNSFFQLFVKVNNAITVQLKQTKRHILYKKIQNVKIATKPNKKDIPSLASQRAEKERLRLEREAKEREAKEREAKEREAKEREARELLQKQENERIKKRIAKELRKEKKQIKQYEKQKARYQESHPNEELSQRI